MTTPRQNVEPWKWVVGVLVTVLMAVCGGAVANVTFDLRNHESRITAVERGMAVNQAELTNIREGVDELRTMFREYLKARP